jgi:hypothetical protein
MAKLQIAGSAVFAAWAGWEIGSYLWNEFAVVRIYLEIPSSFISILIIFSYKFLYSITHLYITTEKTNEE